MSGPPKYLRFDIAQNAFKGSNSKVNATHGKQQGRKAGRKYMLRVVEGLGDKENFQDMEEEVYSKLLPAFQPSVLNNDYPIAFINELLQCLDPFRAHKSVENNYCVLEALLPKPSLASVVFERYRDFFDQEDVSLAEALNIVVIATLLEIEHHDKDLEKLYDELLA